MLDLELQFLRFSENNGFSRNFVLLKIKFDPPPHLTQEF